MKNALCSLFFLFLAVFFPGPLLAAQAKAPEKGAVTTIDPKVAVEDLENQLLPLTKEDLEKEAAAWVELFKKKAQAYADIKNKIRKAKAGAKAPLEKQEEALKKECLALLDRVDAVVAALEDKAGKDAVKDYNAYVDTVSRGLGLVENPVTNVSNTWTKVLAWVKSPDKGLKYATNIIVFLLLLLAFRILAAVLAKVTDRAVRAFKTSSDLLRDFFVNTVRRVTILIGIVVALSVLGINIGPLVAAIGAVGFVVGFALQGTLSNFASGIMILLYRPYDIGDFVNVAGVSGTVSAMSLVSTTIKTPDNQTIIVPNNSIWGGVITNITGNNTRRVDMTFGIDYSDDIPKAQKVLEDILEKHPKVLKDPAPVVKLHELADSSVNFVVRPWTRTSDYWDVYWDVTRAVKERFDQEGISIPFPQQDVHLHKAD